MKEKKEKKHGGGWPLKYGEKTITKTFRIPISKLQETIIAFNNHLKKYQK